MLGMAVGLGMDAFAVALSSGCQLGRVALGPTLRMAAAFGFFQALMPVLGWGLGRVVSQIMGLIAPWVAGALLILVAVHMFLSGIRNEPDAICARNDPTSGWRLWGLALATSIDAFAVGTSLSLFNISIWIPVAVIGVVAFLMTALGMVLGCRLGQWLGRRMEMVGGLILLFIALNLMFRS